jgi:hypothetical protein
MLPAILPGDELVFHSSDRLKPEPGQVVLYRFQGRLIAHRLRASSDDGAHWLIRGDSSPDIDDLPVAREDLLGVLAAQHRNGHKLYHERPPHLLPYPLRWLILRSRRANIWLTRALRLLHRWV